MKNIVLNEKMMVKFGSGCLSGTDSFRYLNEIVLPHVSKGGSVVFDFEGVKAINSSFSNALMANYFLNLGESGFKFLSVINTSRLVKNELRTSMAFGLKQHEDASLAA